MGVPVDGLAVVGFTQMQDWGDLCIKLLGHRLPNREVGASKNTVVMEGPRVKAKWLEERFSNPYLADATKVLMQHYAIYGQVWQTAFNYIYNFSIQSAAERIIVVVVQH